MSVLTDTDMYIYQYFELAVINKQINFIKYSQKGTMCSKRKKVDMSITKNKGKCLNIMVKI